MSEPDVSELRERIEDLVGFVLTAKQDNTDEWMEALVSRINAELNYLGDGDRVEYVGRDKGGYLALYTPEESQPLKG